MTDEAKTPSPLDADPFVQSNPELRAFWDAAETGQLLLKTCTRCERAHWYPRMICPFCHDRSLRWAPSSGEGRVHSFSVMRRVAQPYVLAYVELPEQVLVMTNIVDCAVDAVFIGQAVRVVFRRSDEGRMAPFFTPV